MLSRSTVLSKESNRKQLGANEVADFLASFTLPSQFNDSTSVTKKFSNSFRTISISQFRQ